VERRGGEEGRERGSGELLCVRDRGEGRKKKRKGKKRKEMVRAAAEGGRKKKVRKIKEIKGKGTRVWFERGEKWIRLSLPTRS
jgi:hypothetical protein